MNATQTVNQVTQTLSSTVNTMKPHVLRMNAFVGRARDWRRHPREAVVTVAVVGIAVLMAGSLFARSQEGGIAKVRAQKGEVTIKVSQTGELRAQHQMTISAPTDKQILWMVAEGTYVQGGDSLVVFESEKYVISKSQAQTTVQVERANLDAALNNFHAQQSKEEAAPKRYESLPALARKGYVQESEVEQARLDYLELKSRTGSLAAAVNAARAQVQHANTAVEQEERKLRQGVILAPHAGLVVYATAGSEGEQKKVSIGMTPFEGMDLMYLPDVSSMLVDTEISEVDLSKVGVGLPASVQLDAYPGVSFKGEVVSVGNLARRKMNRATGRASGARIFDVTVRVLDHDPRLKPGLTAIVDIIADVRKDAIHVPMEAIFYDDQEKPVVYVKRRGHVEKRRVELGPSNDRVTIVDQHLREGEEVLLSLPGTV